MKHYTIHTLHFLKIMNASFTDYGETNDQLKLGYSNKFIIFSFVWKCALNDKFPSVIE